MPPLLPLPTEKPAAEASAPALAAPAAPESKKPNRDKDGNRIPRPRGGKAKEWYSGYYRAMSLGTISDATNERLCRFPNSGCTASPFLLVDNGSAGFHFQSTCWCSREFVGASSQLFFKQYVLVVSGLLGIGSLRERSAQPWCASGRWRVVVLLCWATFYVRIGEYKAANPGPKESSGSSGDWDSWRSRPY